MHAHNFPQQWQPCWFFVHRNKVTAHTHTHTHIWLKEEIAFIVGYARMHISLAHRTDAHNRVTNNGINTQIEAKIKATKQKAKIYEHNVYEHIEIYPMRAFK